MKDFVDTFVSLISGVVVTSVTADLAVRVTLFTLLAGFAVTFLTETTVSLTVLGDADLAVLVAEVLLRVAINVKSKKIGEEFKTRNEYKRFVLKAYAITGTDLC